MFKKFKINLTTKKIIIILVLAFLLFPHSAFAATITKGCEIPDKASTTSLVLGQVVDTYEPIIINFNLPGVTQKIEGKSQYEVKNLQCFIIGFYTYFSGVAGILATVMIMYGGVKYVISMGNPSRMGDAKDTIFSAVVGLVLVLGAFVLLNTINPNLTSLKVPGLDLDSIVSYPSTCLPEAKTPSGVSNPVCGDTGYQPSDVEGEYTDERCLFTNGCEWGEYCVPEQYKTFTINDNFKCLIPETICENISEGGQEFCDLYSMTIDPNKKIIGTCTWSDDKERCNWSSIVD